MTKPLIIGVTEGGIGALPQDVRARLAQMDIIIAAPRFQGALPDQANVLDWPKPFSNIYNVIESNVDKSLAILTTGDPLWYGAGASIIRKLGSDAVEVIPAVSGLQLAAARLGWPMADCEIVSVHGRPVSTLKPKLYPRARILVIAENGDSPSQVAALLADSGYGQSCVYVLAHLGGEGEQVFMGRADDWSGKSGPGKPVPAFHIIGVECAPDGPAPSGVAASDASFDNDGKLTKRDVRASALAKLVPFPGAVLWDIGSGSGAVSVDFLRAAPRGHAYAIDRNADQMARAVANAEAHGVTGLHQIIGDADQVLADLPTPDAVFIGGGMSLSVIRTAMDRLRAGGVLVAHAVTLESESVLLEAWRQGGGHLTRVGVNYAHPVGTFHGWRPLMPVTQWHWHKAEGLPIDGEQA